MFVPSLSWQNDHVYIKNGAKSTVFLPAACSASLPATPSPPNDKVPVAVIFVWISSPTMSLSPPLKPVFPVGVTRTYWNPGGKTPSFCSTFPMSVLSLSWQKDRLGYAAGSKRPLFRNFAYVCPEPVLAKRSFLFIKGILSAPCHENNVSIGSRLLPAAST
jgi:hypothetical protein